MTSYLNRVRQQVTTTGVGTTIILAATSDGANAFTMAEAGAVDGKPYNYVIDDGTDVEIHEQEIWTAATRTFTRGAPLIAKSGGVAGTAKIDLSGTAILRVFESAGDLEKLVSGKFAQSLSAGEKAQAVANISPATRTIAAAESITAADRGKTILFNSATAITVTVDPVAALGDGFWCKFRNINVGVITIDPAAAETVDTFQTIAIPKNDNGELHCTGAALHTIGRPAIILLDAQSPTGSPAVLDFALPSGFSKFRIDLVGLGVATDNAGLRGRVSTDGGSTFPNGGSDYGWVYEYQDTTTSTISNDKAGAASELLLSGSISNAAAAGLSGEIELLNPKEGTTYRRIRTTTEVYVTGALRRLTTSGAFFSGSALTNFRLFLSSGNFANQGVTRMYGIK